MDHLLSGIPILILVATVSLTVFLIYLNLRLVHRDAKKFQESAKAHIEREGVEDKVLETMLESLRDVRI